MILRLWVASLGFAIALAACGGGDNPAASTAGASSTGGTGFNTGVGGAAGSGSPNGGTASGTYPGAIQPKRLVANSDDNVLVTSTKAVYVWGGLGVNVDTDVYQKVAAGGTEACGLTTTGSIHCWTPKLTGREPSGSFVDLTASDKVVCGLGSSGMATCNAASGVDASTEPMLPVPADSFAAIDARLETACGILESGGSKCWGYSGASLGLGLLTPTNHDFIAIYTGVSSECGIYGQGNIDCWGVITGNFPTAGGFIQVAMADGSFDCDCALHQDGHVACWGLDCGTLTAPTGVKFAEIAVGYQSACGIVQDGTVKCWGGSATQPAAGTRAF